MCPIRPKINKIKPDQDFDNNIANKRSFYQKITIREIIVQSLNLSNRTKSVLRTKNMETAAGLQRNGTILLIKTF